MERAAAEARYEQLHKDAPYHDGRFQSWSKTRGFEHPYHYSDGVTIHVTPEDLNPDDRFLSRAIPGDDDLDDQRNNDEGVA